MDFKKNVILVVLVSSFVLINLGLVFSQEAAGEQKTTVSPSVVTIPAPAEPQIQWVWGEVSSLDAGSNQVTLKYLDYENDAQKEIIIGADEKTTFENIKSLSELKEKDTVSIDYITGADGKNIAKNISLEKAESESAMPEVASPEAQAPAPTAPAEATPAPGAPEEKQEEPQGISGD